jgi:hypothetical protein
MKKNKVIETEYEVVEETSLVVKEETSIAIDVKSEESIALKRTIKDDFEYARQNVKTIIDTGMEAVENLAVIARQSEAPRIFECLTNLLQINTLNNRMLLEMDQSMKDMIDGKGDGDGHSDSVVNNNTLFVATTTDIQRMIEERIKGIT